VSNSKSNIDSDKTSLVGALVAGKITAMIATFIMPVFLSRFLSKSDYGLYSQFYILLLFLSGFFGLGIQSNLYYFYPTASNETRRVLVLQTFILLVSISIITSSLLFIPIISETLLGRDLIVEYKGYIVIAVLFTIPTSIIESLYVLEKDRRTSIFYPPFVVIIKIVAIIGFALIINNLTSVFNGIIFSSTVIMLFVIYYVYKVVFRLSSKVPKLNIRLLLDQLIYALPFGMAASINTILNRFDKLVCISYLSPSEYATYSVAFFGIPAIQQIYESFAQVYLVEMSKKWQENKNDEIIEIYKNLVSKTYSYTIPAILIFSLYAKKIIIFIFTEKYVDAVPLFRIYLFSFLFSVLGVGLILRASGNTKKTFFAYLHSCFISIPSTYILIKYFGTWGAMSGAMLSLIAPKIFMIYQEINILDSRFVDYLALKNMLKVVIISVLCFIPFALLELYISYNIIISGIVSLFYLIIVFSIEIKYKLFILGDSDIAKIRNKIFSFIN